MANKILHVRTDSIGDLVLASTLHEPIRRAYPDAEIWAIGRERFADLLRDCPFIDRLLTFEYEPLLRDAAYRDQLLRTLQEQRFDLCLNTRYSRDIYCDILANHCGATERIAHSGEPPFDGNIRRAGADRMYTRLVPSSGFWRSELQRNEDFLNAMGIKERSPVQIWSNARAAQAAEEVFARFGLRPDKTLVLYAGAGSPIRFYGEYGNAVADVCVEHGLSVMALGGAADAAVNQHNLQALQGRVPTVDLSNQTSVLEAVEIIRRARVSIGAETGLAHIAGALERPHVVLLGGGHFGRFMPSSPYTTAVCLPLECFACSWACRYAEPYCVRGVVPDALKIALRGTLERTEFLRPRIVVQDASTWRPPPGGPQWGWFPQLLDRPEELEILTLSSSPG